MFVAILDPVWADIAVGVKLAKTYWTEGKGLLVGLGNQVRSIHQTLKVGTVGHAEDVADLVACRLQTPIE